MRPGWLPDRRGDDATVVAAIWPVVDLVRCLTLGYAVYEFWARRDAVLTPGLGWAILGVLGVWTGVVGIARRRTPGWLVAESVLGCAAILLTRYVDSPETIAAGASTVPGLFVVAAVVGWAVYGGTGPALAASVAVAAADLLEVEGRLQPGTLRNIVMLLFLGAGVGYCVDLLRDGHRALAEAMALQARVAERERLARTVHDGVLQTLSFIHRRGRDLGGEAQQLGVLAAEQERVLRTLISGHALTEAVDVSADADLRALLERFDGDRVQIVAPADPVRMPRHRAEELTAAVSAALDNVRDHAGEEARAWVLVEQEADEVLVTVRDDGVGVSEERLLEAMSAGRMGVSRSIMGRLNGLGGQATYSSGAGTGTRVEMRLPIDGEDR